MEHLSGNGAGGSDWFTRISRLFLSGNGGNGGGWFGSNTLTMVNRCHTFEGKPPCSGGAGGFGHGGCGARRRQRWRRRRRLFRRCDGCHDGGMEMVAVVAVRYSSGSNRINSGGTNSTHGYVIIDKSECLISELNSLHLQGRNVDMRIYFGLPALLLACGGEKTQVIETVFFSQFSIATNDR